MQDTHLAFALRRSELVGGILIPKFYDPDVAASIARASSEFDLPELGDLLEQGLKGSKLGDWLRREHYGSGSIPYVRTSDIVGWRIRADYKKGVSEEIYERLKEKQDVRVGDILMVAHGTYLVGNVAIVTEEDRRLVLQDHVFRLRVSGSSGVDAFYLLAALSTQFVRRQVRARQFSADIIDKIGDRHLGIRVPVLRDQAKRAVISQRVRSVIHEQSAHRKTMRRVVGGSMAMLRERPTTRLGFSVGRPQVLRRILLPKYYDPLLDEDLERAQQDFSAPWPTIGDLVQQGFLSATTGVEVGKMSYGTGPVPFIRTSDLADWEVRLDFKHSVSTEVYERYKRKAALKNGDVLLVRDGTYLVGVSALIHDLDGEALFCGGIYRLRVLRVNELSPHALLAMLNLPIVRRQIRSRQFTRDVIDTLGERLMEVRVPPPASDWAREASAKVKELFEQKAATRKVVHSVLAMIEPSEPPRVLGRPGWSMR